ncbi:GAF domain-containing protein [Bacillus sp. JJ1566]|uniref:GAF domain-containing protein n=1 Tax=Bacillus sp. JJ1566 TaxID=3122961 RepID=UPI002FFEDE62
MTIDKKEKLMRKLENHLRSTARHLIKFDTEEEVLQYLTESFRSELYCDFVGVILNEDGVFLPKAWSGNIPAVTDYFPLPINQCSTKLLSLSLTIENGDPPELCMLSKILKQANVKTWFTVPFNYNNFQYGFCIVGFLNYVPLLEMEAPFEEFGKDIAVAMSMAREKNLELNKIKGIEWISKNLSLNAPLEKHVEEINLRAGKGTNADFACIYLYNEKENCFDFQPPSYGLMKHSKRIVIEENYHLNKYFPYLEKPGGTQLSVSIVIDLKTIGVLHIVNNKEVVFTENDLRMLELLSNLIAAVLENARLFNNEKQQKNRLQFLLDYQQSLVKETIEEDNFDGITSMLSNLFHNQVLLFDRFLRPISVGIEPHQENESYLEQITEIARTGKGTSKGLDYFTIQVPNSLDLITLWMINGGGRLLGYLAVQSQEQEMDEIDRLTIEVARNICSIQFIKQKLVLDANEQAKDSFFSRLLVEKIEEEDGIFQYASLFQWNLLQIHYLAVLSISLDQKEIIDSNLFDQQEKKNIIWDSIKSNLLEFDSSILTGNHDEKYILVVPLKDENNLSKKYWNTLYERINNWAKETTVQCKVLMGVGDKTENINDYYISYQ